MPRRRKFSCRGSCESAQISRESAQISREALRSAASQRESSVSGTGDGSLLFDGICILRHVVKGILIKGPFADILVEYQFFPALGG